MFIYSFLLKDDMPFQFCKLSSMFWTAPKFHQPPGFHVLSLLISVSFLQISEIKVADIPDVDLSRLGVTKYGNFIVEVVDPVSDYLELMEVRDQHFSSFNEFMWLTISNCMRFFAACI